MAIHQRILTGLLGTAMVVVLSACSRGSSNSTVPAKINSPGSSSPFAGTVLSPPITLTDRAGTASFQSTKGGEQNLNGLGEGKLLLLYFGYTHCPDVCPTTMADLGQALQNTPAQIRARTQVVFITSDPARDTPAVMRAWLANFDGGLPVPFVGLTADVKQIDTVANSVGVPISPPVKAKDGSISVEHGAQVLAFLNGKASIVWLAGTTTQSYEQDMIRLVEKGNPS